MTLSRQITLLICLCWNLHSIDGFLLRPLSVDRTRMKITSLHAQKPSSASNKRQNSKKKITIKDLQKKIMKNPEAFQDVSTTNKSKKKKRTRRKVDNPKQTYVYAAQRAKMKQQYDQKKQSSTRDSDNNNDADEEELEDDRKIFNDQNNPIVIAKSLGLVNAANHHCEALVDNVQPTIMAQIRVADGNGSDTFAYIIDKPAGWSILGGRTTTSGGKNNQSSSTKNIRQSSNKNKNKNIKRVKIKEEDGSEDFLEFNEDDIKALLTPSERAELEAQGDSLFEISGPAFDDTRDIPGWYEVANMSPEEREEAGIEDEDYDPTDMPDFSEADMLALMSPEEIAEYNEEKEAMKKKKRRKNKKENPLYRFENVPRDSLDPSVQENLKRIEKRLGQNQNTASFSSYSRPSIVSWLKEEKRKEGTPIRGGKFWTAAAGATEVDDSGLVLICPKSNIQNVFVDVAEYVAVVGNGGFLRPVSKKDANEIPTELVDISIISKVKKGREGDICQTVRFSISEHMSTCTSILSHAQSQFHDGIRGDPAANPFDRRSSRRLIHCSALSISSLTHEDEAQVETESVPDDIAILSDRLNNHAFSKGSFLGRTALRDNPLTNAYREINGASDGFPGWTVDRYGDWLFVQHDNTEYKGPLPSIHDGKTAGVYYLPSNPNRSEMGSTTNVRPILLEGRPAPELIPILENGVTYHVSLDKDLSTGIFLDQRLHRAWLTRNCDSNTHVLNCFAHCGAFSVAAATAGASTVSLDLSKKWLDRVQPQLEANGVEFDERHDCIYGDCFEWLAKLSKRGELFDIVILDPPSSSVGKKKRRWSVKNDYDELVALAAPLVRKGGLLWTTTNSASLNPIKFAKMCKKGLDEAGLTNAKLERIQPMPHDFPSIGSESVKNLVWRIP